MSAVATQLPAHCTDLVIRPIGEKGRYVVKVPSRGDFFELGDEEHFLLVQLDGLRTAEEVCAAFQKQFGQPLSEEDLNEFLELARKQSLIQPAEGPLPEAARPAEETGPRERDPGGSRRPKQSLLYWRKKFFNPDRLFTWLEPKIRFFWTRGFLIFSASCIVLAVAVLWANREHAITSFFRALHWETAVLVWVTLLTVTMLHESAHGLTCKHYGGEVHEIGFLLLFFMPGFYCNVSDAWLFREKSKRLWVTLAGGYFALFVWALAVFVWRVTVPNSFFNYLSFIVVAACGVQSLFNFNPLLKLDGYYLLSDGLEIPNLQQRAMGYVKAHLRRFLWGAPRPAPNPRRRVLLSYGMLSWVYSLAFLGLMLFGMARFLGTRWGLAGLVAVAVLGLMTTRGLFHGFTAGEVTHMIRKRRLRTIAWLVFLACLPAVLYLYEIEDRAGGELHLRSTVRSELRAPVSAFLREVYVAEGQRVSPGAPVLRLEIPDLDSRLAQKRAELAEAQSQLRLLETGTRPEEITAQRQRIIAARQWRDVVQQDLDRARAALSEQLAALDQQVARAKAELDAAEGRFARSQRLHEKKVGTDDAHQEAERVHRSALAQWAQAKAEKGSLEKRGVQLIETELAEREKELADHQTALRLLEAGTRPEEIEAQRARVVRLQEELRYLEDLQQKLLVYSPVHGLVTTPRFREKLGQFFHEGELILLVEDPAALEAEVHLDEQSARRVQDGQPAALKARSLPLETIAARVRRIASVVEPGDATSGTSSHVTVYCDLDQPQARLTAGMSGYARIDTGRRPVGSILLDRLLRHLRTEYWW